jgi:hypothetical protein
MQVIFVRTPHREALYIDGMLEMSGAALAAPEIFFALTKYAPIATIEFSTTFIKDYNPSRFPNRFTSLPRGD